MTVAVEQLKLIPEQGPERGRDGLVVLLRQLQLCMLPLGEVATLLQQEVVLLGLHVHLQDLLLHLLSVASVRSPTSQLSALVWMA